MIKDVCRELMVSVFPFYVGAESICTDRSFDKIGGTWRQGRIG
jgi:hypothetical protein